MNVVGVLKFKRREVYVRVTELTGQRNSRRWDIELQAETFNEKTMDWLYKRFDKDDRLHVEIQKDLKHKTVIKDAILAKINMGILSSSLAKMVITLVADNFRECKGEITIIDHTEPEKVIFT